MADVQPQPPTVPQLAIPQAPLEGEQLEEAVIKQIDYYFSRQNLANDAYLVSQMDSDMWVPIATIAGFKKVHMLTNDAASIARIMAKSSNVVVDTTRMSIKPNWKLQRNTLILRDIPSDAPTDEVKQIFGEKYASSEVHADVGNTWFVTFADEETALGALEHLRNASFRDKPVKARMKSEHLLKSGGVVPVYPPAPYAADAAYGQYRGGYGYGGRPPYQGQYYDGQADAGKGDRRGGYKGGRRNQAVSPADTAAVPAAAPGQPSGGQRTPRGGYKQDAQAGGATAAAAAVPVDKKRNARKGKKPESKITQVVTNGVITNVIVPELTMQHFPSLTSPSNGRVISKSSFKTGYTTDFRRYGKEDILKIVKNVQDINTRPSSIVIVDAGVIESKPNVELEITKSPHTPEIPTDVEAPQELNLDSVSSPGSAPHWPIEKRPLAAASQQFVPKSADEPAAPAAAPAPASPAIVAPVPVPASPSVKKEGDGTASPSLNSSSEGGLRFPSYADIALGTARTNSPPIKPASPSLPSTPSAAPTIPPATLAAAPPAPSSDALEGKPQ